MAGHESSAGSSPSHTSSLQQPKILLSKAMPSRLDSSNPAMREAGNGGISGASPAPSIKMMRNRGDETFNPQRTRLSQHIVSETWDFHVDRFLDRLSDNNTDFTVIGVLGTTGAGKSTIMNELYGIDENSQGLLSPFPVQTEETRAMMRHCSIGIELRTSVERFILLDTQPVFSPSILAEMMRPDGSSTIPVLSGEALSAELAHELMGIQIGVFLASVCHILLVVTEGIHDISLWKLLSTVHMLKQGIPDPSLLNHSTMGMSHSHGLNSMERDDGECVHHDSTEYFADPVFIHTKLLENECSPYGAMCLDKALSLYFNASSFRKTGAVRYFPSSCPQVDKQSECLKNSAINLSESEDNTQGIPSIVSHDESNGNKVNFFVLPLKAQDDSSRVQHESYTSMLSQLRDRVLSSPKRSFTKPITERDWLRSAAQIWEMVKRSPVIIDYCKMLQGSGLFRR